MRAVRSYAPYNALASDLDETGLDAKTDCSCAAGTLSFERIFTTTSVVLLSVSSSLPLTRILNDILTFVLLKADVQLGPSH
jgi:hypothetical protein